MQHITGTNHNCFRACNVVQKLNLPIAYSYRSRKARIEWVVQSKENCRRRLVESLCHQPTVRMGRNGPERGCLVPMTSREAVRIAPEETGEIQPWCIRSNVSPRSARALYTSDVSSAKFTQNTYSLCSRRP